MYISHTRNNTRNANNTNSNDNTHGARPLGAGAPPNTSNLPTKIIIPAKICRPIISGKSPMDMRILALGIQILSESDPPKSTISARRLAAPPWKEHRRDRIGEEWRGEERILQYSILYYTILYYTIL